MHLTLLLLPLSYCFNGFVCTYCSVPAAFPEGLQGVGGTPSPLCKGGTLLAFVLASPWSPCGCTLFSALWLMLDVCFLGYLHSPGSPGVVTHPLGLLSHVFQPIFRSSSVLHWLQHRETVTCSKPADTANCWQANGGRFFYDCSLWDFMAGKTICLLLQCLTEAGAIICEGSAMFPKSQKKIQQRWGVLVCSLYINPQLPRFKVSWVFHAS